MLKGYWLRSNCHQNELPDHRFRKSGVAIMLCLMLLHTSFPAITAPSPISVAKIQDLEKKSHGDIQKRFRAWAQLMQRLSDKPENVKLEEVNSFFNQFNFQSDFETHGVEDYWKSPEEFIIDGGGDCEDYAIIKYFTLISLGVPTEKLRITYVTSLTLKQAHMVLSYYPTPEAEPLILDSLESKILKASKRSDLKPVYSFNGEGLWLAKQPGNSSSVGNPGSLSKWDEVIKRMQ